MELSIGTLPTHHGFLAIIRPVTDWVFKFISWLVIAATLALAYEKTKNPWLLGAAGIAGILPCVFLYSCFDWLSRLERKPKAGQKVSASAQQQKPWKQRLRNVAVVVLSFGLWGILTIGSQVAVQQTAAAILEFQKVLR